MRRLSRAGTVVAALLGLLAPVLAATPASAQPAPSSSTAGVGINEVRTLHLIRLNCDDEAEHFSDEVRMYINGNFAGGRNNMDGGDWWDFNFLPGPFEAPVLVQFYEDSGWLIGQTTVSTDQAFLGLLVDTYSGFHGTHFQYRFTWYVD